MAASLPRGFLFTGVLLAGMAAACAASGKSPEDFVGPAQTPPAKPASAATPAPQGASGKASAAPAAKPAAPAAKAAPARPAARGPVLDTAKLHATYLDGDFEQAIRTMEAALKSKRTLTHGDSVFIFKHLGVMYAATPATREKGRYYMAQLIYVEPTAKILDMYASDMIYLIFRNVQEEFENKHPRVAKTAPVDTEPKPAAAPAPAPAPAPVARQSSSKSKTLYWVTGGAVVAAGTVGLLFVLLDDPKPKKHNIVLPE